MDHLLLHDVYRKAAGDVLISPMHWICHRAAIEIDRARMKISVTTTEPEEDWPAIICAVFILADPHDDWTVLYNQINKKLNH